MMRKPIHTINILHHRQSRGDTKQDDEMSCNDPIMTANHYFFPRSTNWKEYKLVEICPETHYNELKNKAKRKKREGWKKYWNLLQTCI